MKLKLILMSFILTFSLIGIFFFKHFDFNPNHKIGDAIDSLNGVKVYYNGRSSHIGERTVSKDGYNIGLQYQCVEFVKRYYYEYYHHKMPNSYGNAIDFFNPSLPDGTLNPDRNLIQFTNPSSICPKIGDLLVFSATPTNPFGHVAIVSFISNDEIEIIQQNPGTFGRSRLNFDLNKVARKWSIENDRIVGWLRMRSLK